MDTAKGGSHLTVGSISCVFFLLALYVLSAAAWSQGQGEKTPVEPLPPYEVIRELIHDSAIKAQVVQHLFVSPTD